MMFFENKEIKENRRNDFIYWDIRPQKKNYELVNESCSVNEDVLKWSEIAEKQIIDDAGDKICHGRKYGDIIKNSIDINNLPFELVVEYIFYMFDGYSDYNDTINYDAWTDTSDWEDNKFKIRVQSPVIGDRLSAFYFIDSITHEMEHIFSVITTKKNFRNNNIEEILYRRSDIYVHGGHSNSKTLEVAWMYYLSRWYERHAFTHGLYSSLSILRKTVTNIETIYDKFKETDQYKHLLRMKDFIDNYDSYYKTMISFFTIPKIMEDRQMVQRYIKYHFGKLYLEHCYKKYADACSKVINKVWEQKVSSTSQYQVFETFGKRFHYQE